MSRKTPFILSHSGQNIILGSLISTSFFFLENNDWTQSDYPPVRPSSTSTRTLSKSLVCRGWKLEVAENYLRKAPVSHKILDRFHGVPKPQDEEFVMLVKGKLKLTLICHTGIFSFSGDFFNFSTPSPPLVQKKDTFSGSKSFGKNWKYFLLVAVWSIFLNEYDILLLRTRDQDRDPWTNSKYRKHQAMRLDGSAALQSPSAGLNTRKN